MWLQCLWRCVQQKVPVWQRQAAPQRPAPTRDVYSSLLSGLCQDAEHEMCLLDTRSVAPVQKYQVRRKIWEGWGQGAEAPLWNTPNSSSFFWKSHFISMAVCPASPLGSFSPPRCWTRPSCRFSKIPVSQEATASHFHIQTKLLRREVSLPQPAQS